MASAARRSRERAVVFMARDYGLALAIELPAEARALGADLGADSPGAVAALAFVPKARQGALEGPRAAPAGDGLVTAMVAVLEPVGQGLADTAYGERLVLFLWAHAIPIIRRAPCGGAIHGRRAAQSFAILS